MTCRIVSLDLKDGPAIAIVCGSAWGIGTYNIRDEDNNVVDTGYGFYRTRNPYDWRPDRESCTAAEVAAWEAACALWDDGLCTDCGGVPAAFCCEARS